MAVNETPVLHCDETLLQDKTLNNDYIEDLFDQEGAFGEADCAGL